MTEYIASVVLYTIDGIEVATVDNVAFESSSDNQAKKDATRKLVIQILDRAESVTT